MYYSIKTHRKISGYITFSIHDISDDRSVLKISLLSVLFSFYILYTTSIFIVIRYPTYTILLLFWLIISTTRRNTKTVGRVKHEHWKALKKECMKNHTNRSNFCHTYEFWWFFCNVSVKIVLKMEYGDKMKWIIS